eukprot:TRINITY_DN30756_c0_g1_i2.p3 TRINITY_DN30756_c0_g1~~TRINITY_DN30756_c0_g1_i2.p3  ORF type:complete len:118 (+),score=12.26 TRINITY_DN30756_c0_g1_i2:269-622(+)
MVEAVVKWKVANRRLIGGSQRPMRMGGLAIDALHTPEPSRNAARSVAAVRGPNRSASSGTCLVRLAGAAESITEAVALPSGAGARLMPQCGKETGMDSLAADVMCTVAPRVPVKAVS